MSSQELALLDQVTKFVPFCGRFGLVLQPGDWIRKYHGQMCPVLRAHGGTLPYPSRISYKGQERALAAARPSGENLCEEDVASNPTARSPRVVVAAIWLPRVWYKWCSLWHVYSTVGSFCVLRLIAMEPAQDTPSAYLRILLSQHVMHNDCLQPCLLTDHWCSTDTVAVVTQVLTAGHNVSQLLRCLPDAAAATASRSTTVAATPSCAR